jgi:hypothetical protein
MNRKRFFAVLGTVLAAVTASLVVASPARADDHTVPLQSRVSLKCLQPAGESLDAGAPIVQMPCNRSDAQTWFLKDLGNHVVRAQNLRSGLCMDAFGGATNGTPIVQWPCSGISNQKFQASKTMPEIVTLRSRVAGTSSHCLDVPGGQQGDGLAMQLWVCNGTVSQLWGAGIVTIIWP